MMDELKKDYIRYVSGFRTDDPRFNRNITMKEKHSLRVCREILDIGASLGLDAHRLFVAEVCALFHDIGRYEQFRKYGTFVDMKSENHARLGVKIIRENRMLDRLVPEDREVVLSAVENHNKLRVADTLNPEERFFAELLRDADKIDIWRVVLAHYTSEDGDGLDSIELGLPDLPEVSDDICRDLLAGNMVTATRMSSLNDFKLLQMGWVYDLNFRRSFEIVRERGYIGKIYETMPQTARINRIYRRIEAYLKEKTASSKGAGD
ncbi:MAG: HD family phosphohydrolase [Deltaproteobacteria bacterium]|nr:MAG: HD family phosphohydrolase [Deltaproteobacteria bacterium]